jgi:L-fuconolactonase
MPMPPIIDSHQHLWDLDAAEYPWLVPAYGPLYRTFPPEELVPQLARAGVDRTVLVQAADNHADTDLMLGIAARFDYVAAIVGWVPLDRPDDTRPALNRLRGHAAIKGIRHLIHVEADPDWLLQRSVIDGLRLLVERGLTFDIPAVLPRHLEHLPTLAREVPGLTIVIDHLAKPPIKDRGWEPWASLLARAAEAPNVYAKISGLNTAADFETWTAADLKPYIDHAIACFGADRLMFGSDWPVAILAGDYQKVWEETVVALADLRPADRAAILGGTANAVYGLGL